MKTLVMLSFVLFFSQAFAQGNSSDLEKGLKLYKQENYEESIKVFLDILDKNENNAEAHYHLAFSYFRSGELDEGIEHAEKAVELDENNAEYHYRLGLLYTEDVRDASIFRAPRV